jgi:fructose-bisphosphate aldolase class I
MQALAKYAKIVQNNNMVPMVEPEVLMDGSHTIDQCYEITSKSLKSLFRCLKEEGVNIAGTILKPNMVTSGSTAESQATAQKVAEMTVKCLNENVPSDLPGVTFLSGGQSDVDATAHLDAMNKIGGFPWKLSFSYGRALQQPSLKAWLGKEENIPLAQDALSHRALMNKLAANGAWNSGLEN